MKKNIIFLFLSFFLLQAHGQKRMKWYGDKDYRYRDSENCKKNKVNYKKKVVTMSNGWDSKLRKKKYRKDEVYTPYGDAEYYYCNGKLKHKGYWKNGVKQGIWKTYYENGTGISRIREFNNDKLKGVFKSFFTNGQVDEEIKFIDETFVYIKRYYPNGQLKEEGKAERESEYHYEMVQKEVKWVDNYVSYYSDGKIKEKGQHILTFFDDGSIDDIKKVGLWQTYYANGNIKIENNYSKVYDDYYDEYNYKLTGVSKFNYENGKPYKHRYYNSKGDFLKNEYFYKNGKLRITLTSNYNEKPQTFDDKGKKAEIIFYDKNWKIVSHNSDAEFYRIYNPNRNGTSRIVRDYYLDTHSIQWEGCKKIVDKQDNSKDEECEGENKQYYNIQKKYNNIFTKPQIASKYFIDTNGKLTGIFEEYYESGKVKMNENWIHGEREGKYIGYHKNGNIKLEGNFKNGKREGIWKQYRKNSVIEAEVNFTKGEKNKLKKYDENGIIIN